MKLREEEEIEDPLRFCRVFFSKIFNWDARILDLGSEIGGEREERDNINIMMYQSAIEI